MLGLMFCMVSKLPHLYSTRSTPQYNVIQLVPPVQCFVTDLNDVTENTNTNCKNKNHFKHSIKMINILNILSK